MGLDVLAFGFGGILLLVGLLGGGFELKELKLPKVTWLPRLVTGVMGMFFICVGVGVHQANKAPPVQPSVQSALAEPPARTRVETSPERVTARPTLVNDPAPAAAPAAPAFQGVTAKVRIEWRLGSDSYTAVVHTWGAAGVADVLWSSPTQGMASIRQDLALEARDIGWLYVGSNPRVGETPVPANYSPDMFRLAPSGNGWTFVDTCDAQGACSPVTTTVLE